MAADPEEGRVELARVLQERAAARVGRALVVRVRVVEAGDVPAAIGGEVRDRVDAAGDELPQLLGRAHLARVAAADADDRDRLVDRCAGALDDGDLDAADLLTQEARHRRGRRVVEGERGGQLHTGDLGQAVAQLDRHQRVEAEVGEGQLGRDRVRRVVAEDGGDVRAHLGQHRFVPRGLGQRGEALGERRAAGVLAPGRGLDEAAQQAGQPPDPRQRLQRRQVDVRGQQPRPAGAQGVVEQLQARFGLHRHEPEARADLARAGVVEAGGHPALLRPQAPGHRRRGEAVAAAALGERVEVGVGRRVVALAGAAEQRAGGREEHELLEGHGPGQLVEGLGRVDLGREHAVDLVGLERRDRAVLGDARAVHDGGQRAAVQERGERGAVGHVAGRDLDVGVEFLQLRRALGLCAAAGDQQEALDAVALDEVARDERARDRRCRR